jgi:hypothetical protein
MKDVATGSAGIVSVVLYIVGAIIALSLSSGFELFKIILLSEILSKFSMVLMASLGNSATVGSNSPFVHMMKDKRKLAIAAIITLIPFAIIGEPSGFLVLASGIVITMFLVGISTRHFGGITGDVLGETNHSETKISKDASLTISLVAPSTSPVIPPKCLVEIPTKNIVITIPLANTKNPDGSPIIANGIKVIIAAIASFLLSFIICTNGEFEPTVAEFPRLAINTIENLDRISLRRIILKSSNPLESDSNSVRHATRFFLSLYVQILRVRIFVTQITQYVHKNVKKCS